MIKVLLIDDSELRGQLVARVLAREADIEVRLADGIETAIAVAEELLPTVAVRAVGSDDDPALPDLERLRSSPSMRDVPVVVLSGVDDPALRKRLLSRGFAAVALQSEGSGPLLEKLRAQASRYLASLGGAAETAPDEESPASPIRVFMIDDSPFLCLACERRLEHIEEVVFGSCSAPSEALAAAGRFGPTVILLDLEMPELSGFELLPRLKGDPRTEDVPVIVLSGTEDPSVKARVFGIGADDYAQKDMDREIGRAHV